MNEVKTIEKVVEMIECELDFYMNKYPNTYRKVRGLLREIIRVNEKNDKEIRAKAIDEFAELLKGKLVRKYANTNLTQQYVALQVTDWCNEIAEQMKAGGENENRN